MMEKRHGNKGKIKEIDLHKFMHIVRQVYYENKRFTVAWVAKELGISKPTLSKNYLTYLQMGCEMEDRERAAEQQKSE